MEDEVDGHRSRREHDRAIENLLEAIRAHETRNQYRWRSELRRRAENRRGARRNTNQREERHERDVINQRSWRNSRGSIRRCPMQRARGNFTEPDQRRGETWPRRDSGQEICDLRHSLPRRCEYYKFTLLTNVSK